MGKYYTVQIRASKCHYQVRINDAIIYIGSDGYNVDFELPINHLTFLGANAVGISILPLKNQTQLSELSIFKITVYEREHKEDRENRKDLSNYKAPDFHAKDSTPPTILLNQLQFENTDPHFKNIDWNNSLQKFNPDEIYSQVVSYYKFFHQLFLLSTHHFYQS